MRADTPREPAPESEPAAIVDLDAVRANVRAFGAAVDTPVLAVVKADAYGHGMASVARAAVEAGAAWLGVVDPAEGADLRAAGLRVPILAWMLPAGLDWESAFAAELDLAVSSLAQLDELGRAAADRRRGRHGAAVAVHVKLDTGLGRNGAHERDWPPLFAGLAALEATGTVRCRGIMSHFAGAGEAADARQLAAFERALALAEAAGVRPEVRHIAASRAALELPAARFDLVRLGIAAYGLSPLEAGAEAGLGLRPAMRLEAPLVDAGAGEALVELGLVDGLPPLAGAHPGPECVDDAGGRWRVAEVGEVATRLVRAGSSSSPGARLALVDPARESADADAWARAAGTINYEIPTRLSPRVPRRFEHVRAADDEHGDLWPLHDDVVGAPRRLAARRLATVDLGVAAERLDALAARARGVDPAPLADAVDVTADAYGHGALALIPLIRRAGLRPLVRRERDAVGLARLGEPGIEVVPGAPPSTRRVFGVDAAAPSEGPSHGPLMALASELVLVKRLRPGDGVSYGLEWVADRPRTVGLVPLGYADAVPRRAGGRASLVIEGRPARVLGRVAMDQLVVDLEDLDAWVGARASAFGAGPGETPLATWARWCGLPPLAVTSTLGPRVERALVGGDA